MQTRAIVAIALVIATLFGWREYLIHTQRNAVAAIRRAGGGVVYDWELQNARTLRQSARSDLRAWLVRALGPDLTGHVVAVNLNVRKDGIANSVLEQVGRLSRLETLLMFDSS